MSKKFSKKPLALAMGAAFALGGGAAQASVFAMSDLAGGYMVAQATPATPAMPAKKGEARCGADCVKNAKAEGMKEGDAKAACEKAHKEGKCGGDKKGEGKCGEGKCGGSKAKAEEGKCGEGKCGGKK
jgi:uncharacterized low-complexity protein